MSLYITRHGETDYNIKELVCGISEAMLSDKGIKQAQKLADLLRNIDYKFLYVSPLQRAIDTANYANVHQVEMIIEPRIREFNFGKCEGVYRRDEKAWIYSFAICRLFHYSWFSRMGVYQRFVRINR